MFTALDVDGLPEMLRAVVQDIIQFTLIGSLWVTPKKSKSLM